MNILEKTLFTGKDAESYGEIGEIRKGWLRMVYSVMLGEKFGKKCLIIKTKTTAPLSASVQYAYLDKEAVRLLRKICDDALKKM